MNPIAWIVVILLIIGAAPTWPYSHDWGYYPDSGLLLLLILIVVLTRRKA